MQTIDQYFNNTLVFVRLSMKFWEKIPSFPCNNCVTKPTNCLSCQESFESGDNYLCLRYESPCLACEGFDLDATNHNNKPCQEDCQKCSETSESEWHKCSENYYVHFLSNYINWNDKLNGWNLQ